MQFKNLRILGTSHIAIESINEVKRIFHTYNPDIVALELDKRRLMSLLSEKEHKPSFRDVKRVGFKGFVFNLIGAYIEKKLGKLVGVKPGSEMKLAFHLAKERNIKVALVDQNIEITLQNFSKEFTWREKFRFVFDIIKGAIFRKPEIKFDLSKVPKKEMIEMMIKKVKERYPNFYKVLVEDRNKAMANNLARLMKHFPDQKILAVMGAGHEKELLDMIKHKI